MMDCDLFTQLEELRFLRIYGAGRISKHDWRFSGERVDAPTDTVDQDRDADAPLCKKNGIDWVYVGPWFRGCDHGCTHVPNSHAATFECSSGDIREVGFEGLEGVDPVSRSHLVQEIVLRNSLHQIAKCDVFYARITDGESYGTFAEVGYAHALGKPIYLDVRNKTIVRDLWFLVRMAVASPLDEKVLRALPWMDFQGTLTEYRDGLLALLDTEYPHPEASSSEMDPWDRPDAPPGI
jgi:nucleoside 2-deoxyribosyltransferase